MKAPSMNWIDQLAQARIPRPLAQRRIAQTGLGILRALRESTMSVAEAEADLFNLDTYRALRRRKFSPQLIEFMEWGMELEDVAALAADGLDESYREMEQLLLQVISSTLVAKPTRRRPDRA